MYFPEVTKLLLFFSQACHELVPPEVNQPFTFVINLSEFFPLHFLQQGVHDVIFKVVESGVKTIANNFVTERNSNEVMAVGYVLLSNLSS